MTRVCAVSAELAVPLAACRCRTSMGRLQRAAANSSSATYRASQSIPRRSNGAVGAAPLLSGNSGGRSVRAHANKRPGVDGTDTSGAKAEKAQRKEDNTIIAAGVVLLMGAVLLGATVGRDEVEDIVYGAAISSNIGVFSAGDVFGGLLWSFSLWFTSPWQLLLLFLGAIETERPSDWLIEKFGRIIGQPVDAVDYSAPTGIRLAAAGVCILTGFSIAAVCELGLGDATWAVSTGIGSILVSGIYEAGRPQRLSPEEAVALEEQWQDFAGFAEDRLLRKGRCHESEVFSAFRKSFARYRDPSVVPDPVLRDMVRNWHPGAQRTGSGFYKNVSLREVADPFQ
eukprot:jgi/Tetstr1/454891/TSEL_041755.t1